MASSSVLLGIALVFPLSLLIYRTLVSEFGESYGLFHLALNRLPGEPATSPPATEWLNMGYWKGTSVFSHACRALASKLVSAARLKEGATILDVGFGTGQSILFLLSDPSIPRPSKIVGITNNSSHCERARRRVERAHPHLTENIVSLVNADAISDGAPDHPLSPTTLFPPFDAILALDCAYHFNSRRLFLEQSFARLNPGGRIALADICFSKNDLDTFKTRLVTSLLRMMPLCNRVSLEEYQLHMQQTGYEEVEVEDITADVFSPFIAFLKTQGFGWWTFAVMLDVYVGSGARFVIASGLKVV